MECCYPIGDCEPYSVTPVFVAHRAPAKYCEEPPMCCPRLPECPGKIMYCCEAKPKTVYCCEATPTKYCCEKKPPREEERPAPCKKSPPCCQAPAPCPPPVKTKYIIPCYRYEDGRINQTTVLMRRACEVACGARARRKPFVVSSYHADPEQEVRRYHSEDAKGNCCIHFERSSCAECVPVPSCYPIGPCVSSPGCDYVDYVAAEPCTPPSCCYYCRQIPR
ncbi:uncharacterized protein LOC142980865 [Anticarsia gemmatalis]|uniref:uncharacterized protein LOC142980865 n=1 Tax=Anticarsia gemmatalis TaxID=129554 RepID=UPI003F7666A6